MNKDALAAQLEIDEAKKYKPYDDATGKEIPRGATVLGKITIGIGRNLTDKGLHPDEIRYLLGNDIDEVCDQLDAALPWWRSMSDRRQQALANMCFNMGIGNSTKGLLSFRNTLEAMHRGDYSAAARGMLDSTWAKQVGDRAKRLADMMEKG